MRCELLACERGNSFIELAFAAPLLVTFIIGTVDMSMAYSQQLALEQVAQRTVERVQRNSYLPSQKATLKAEAEAAAGSGAVATISEWLECNGNGIKLDFTTGSCSAGASYSLHVEVELDRSFNPIFGQFFPNANSSGAVPLEAKAGIRLQ